MKNLLILVMLLMPFSLMAAEADYGDVDGTGPGENPRVLMKFLDNDVMMELRGEQVECFNQRLQDCPTVWIENGVTQNPEDTNAARACQRQALTSC